MEEALLLPLLAIEVFAQGLDYFYAQISRSSSGKISRV
jgi:hypothetical protein